MDTIAFLDTGEKRRFFSCWGRTPVVQPVAYSLYRLSCPSSILQHAVALCRSALLFCILFPSVCSFDCSTHVVTVELHYMLRPNWPSSAVQVLTRQLLLPRVLCMSVPCCSHARVVNFCFVGRICLLFRCVAMFVVFVCCIRCLCFRGGPSAPSGLLYVLKS
jgi:hypothetical protein